MNTLLSTRRLGWAILLAALAITAAVYAPGLWGGYVFDDYPNIVDNRGVQPADASLPSLVNAALSSPSSEFKRPLASLSFAVNYLANGLDPFGMKVTNLVIHLLNGLLVFLLTRLVLRNAPDSAYSSSSIRTEPVFSGDWTNLTAAVISAAWMLLPINLTSVLYVVQRMESLANIFVLLGLIGYLIGRRSMLGEAISGLKGNPQRGLILCVTSVLVCTALGLLAKETAAMLPLYACIAEYILFGFLRQDGRHSRIIIVFFLLTLVAPLCIGLAWLSPRVLQASSWATRDFTLETRLLSEARVVCDYVAWTILPTPNRLSFYHDDFLVSQGLMTPWTTLPSIIMLGLSAVLAFALRQRQPIVALGLLWYLGSHLLTATILPLELVYEHRNYFASLGLMLALVPVLISPPHAHGKARSFMAWPRRVLLGGLLVLWTGLTSLTANAWSSPLSLAQELAVRAPHSPRAQYELGRTYIIYSNYKPESPFVPLAYEALERAAALPNSSVLPQQALIFMNSRMHLPVKDAWWDSMIAKVQARSPGVQDESALEALAKCASDGSCNLPTDRMSAAFEAALKHPTPRVLAAYGEYAWNVLKDQNLGCNLIKRATLAAPGESAYKITLVRMLLATNHPDQARATLKKLQAQNIAGKLDKTLTNLQELPGWQ